MHWFQSLLRFTITCFQPIATPDNQNYNAGTINDIPRPSSLRQSFDGYGHGRHFSVSGVGQNLTDLLSLYLVYTLHVHSAVPNVTYYIDIQFHGKVYA